MTWFRGNSRSAKRWKKRRTMRFARWLERTLQTVWGKKLWILTYSIAIATAYYGGTVGHGVWDDPMGEAEAELKKDRGQADVVRLVTVSSQLKEAMESYHAALKSIPEAFRTNIMMSPLDGKAAASFDGQKLQLALHQAEGARTKMSAAIGRVKGCRFESGLFTDLFKGYEEDLRDMDSMLLGFQRVLQAAVSGGIAGAEQAAGEVRPLLVKGEEASAALEQRAGDSAAIVKHTSRSLEIEVDRTEFLTTIAGVRSLIFLLMIALTVILGVLAFKSGRTSKLYSPSLGGRPELARTQREKYARMSRS